MAFRDDRDAQLARAAALERENRRLEEELARHKAEVAAAAEAIAAAEARGRAAVARERQVGAREAQAKLAEENAGLREELERARGPGLARRAATWGAGLRLAAPSGDGGYWRSALEAWRIYAPVSVGLVGAAAFVSTRAIVVALLVPAVAAALAAVVLPIPWLLRRRRRALAGGIAGGALGPAFSLAIYDAATHGGLPMTMYLMLPTTIVIVAGLLLTGAVRVHLMLGLLVVFSPILALPSPGHLMVWMALAFTGAHVADPRAMSD